MRSLRRLTTAWVLLFCSACLPTKNASTPPTTPTEDKDKGAVLVPSTTPTAPTGLAGQAFESFSNLLQWTDNATNETGFEIERQSSDGKDVFAKIATIAADSNRYTDKTAIAGKKYNYRVRAINAAADSEYSDVITVETQALVLGFIGDSITAGVGCSGTGCNAVTAATTYLQSAGLKVTSINRGISGATTRDWMPGKSYLAPAIAAFTSAHVETVSIMLGTNDSKNTVNVLGDEYFTNITAITTALLAPATGIKHVILHQPLYIVPGTYGNIWDANSNLLVIEYGKRLNMMVIGTRGDRSQFAAFQANPSGLLSDGVHPNNAGHIQLGKQWAKALLSSGL